MPMGRYIDLKSTLISDNYLRRGLCISAVSYPDEQGRNDRVMDG
jgi:hypothetical protein